MFEEPTGCTGDSYPAARIPSCEECPLPSWREPAGHRRSLTRAFIHRQDSPGPFLRRPVSAENHPSLGGGERGRRFPSRCPAERDLVGRGPLPHRSHSGMSSQSLRGSTTAPCRDPEPDVLFALPCTPIQKADQDEVGKARVHVLQLPRSPTAFQHAGKDSRPEIPCFLVNAHPCRLARRRSLPPLCPQSCPTQHSIVRHSGVEHRQHDRRRMVRIMIDMLIGHR